MTRTIVEIECFLLKQVPLRHQLWLGLVEWALAVVLEGLTGQGATSDALQFITPPTSEVRFVLKSDRCCLGYHRLLSFEIHALKF